MKKLFCILLSLTLIFAVFAPAAYAASADSTVYPTIIVSGYSSSDLFLDGEQVWKLDMSGVLNLVLSNIARIGRGLGELAFQKPEYLVDLIGPEVLNLTKYLANNPDGSSVYDLTTYAQDAEHTQFSYLYNEMGGNYVHEAQMMADVAALYGPNGNDYIFCYQHDFRKSMVDCAATLDRYIDSVLSFTGAEKVNIVAVSHGGQTVAAYLAMYGMEKNVIHNAVMLVPAIGGAALAYDTMSETVALDEETLLYFIENGQMLEEDINWLVRAHQFGALDLVCNLLIHKYIKQIIGYWGSIWDFIPTEYYEELKQTQLDPVQSAALIEKSDYFHYEILAHISETMQACVEEGMNLYIVAGAGMPSVTGLQEQSDAIITVHDATGAETAPYGLRFNDGYQQVRTVCRKEEHNHLSPDMAIDASACYLPDYTWFVNGMYHGMGWKDQYCVDLCETLLFSDERISVFSDPRFPQFKYSTNRNYSVIASFDSSPEGYWTANDRTLTVTNLSHKYTMRLISVSIDGADAVIPLKKPIYIDPQGSCTLEYIGTPPEMSLTTADITINYSLIGSVTPIGSRTLVFTVMNGAPAAYDANAPFAQANRTTQFEKNLSDSAVTVMKKTGIFDWLKMVINSLFAIIKSVTLK